MATTPLNIPKIPIRDLIKETIITSSLLAIIDFRDLVLVNPNFTYVELMESLVRKALANFERKCPLFKKSRVYMASSEYTFEDTFQSFLDGTITEEYTTLIPKVVYSMDNSLLHARRSWIYTRPTLQTYHSMKLVYVDYMTSYPFISKSETEVDEFTTDSAIYYIPLHNGTTQDFMFKRQFYLEVLKYINNIKNNLQYPDMPIQLLQGLDMEIQSLFSFQRLNDSNKSIK
jgi:hypothetical protein